jgi:hypothetical protein
VRGNTPINTPVASSAAATIQMMVRVPSHEMSTKPVRNVPTIEPTVEAA